MIYDHGVRVFDNATRSRFKAIMDGHPMCGVCAQELGTHLWLNPRTGHVIPMCKDHYTEHESEVAG